MLGKIVATKYDFLTNNNKYTFRNRVSSEIAKVSQLDVDNWHVFSADNPGPGVLDTAGVARSVGLPGWTATGSVCIPMKEHRVGITEFFGNPNDWEGGKLKAALVCSQFNDLSFCTVFVV